jgi:hypothetical protein
MRNLLTFLMFLAISPVMLAQEGFEVSISGGPGQAYLIMNEDTSKTANTLYFSAQAGWLLTEKLEVFTGVSYWGTGLNVSVFDQASPGVVQTRSYGAIGIPVGVRYYLTSNLYGAVRVIPSWQTLPDGDEPTDPVYQFEFTEGDMNNFHLFSEINLGYAIHVSDLIDIDLEPRLIHSLYPVIEADGLNGNLFEYGFQVRLQYRFW